jgi:hypothetical protein
MTPETRKHAGILIVIIPTVIYGGVSILGFLVHDPAYMQIRFGKIFSEQVMHMQVYC